MRLRRKLVIFFGVVLCAAIGLAGFVLLTSRGSDLAVRENLRLYGHEFESPAAGVSGNLIGTLTYRDVVLRDPVFLPEGTVIEVQRLDISLRSPVISGIHVEVHNGRVRIPGMNPVLVSGTLRARKIAASVFAAGLGVQEALKVFIPSAAAQRITGKIGYLDLRVEGTPEDLSISGPFDAQSVSTAGMSVSGCRGTADLHVFDAFGAPRLKGTLALSSGLIAGPRGIMVDLHQSVIRFDGDPGKPVFDLAGTSAVEGIRISLVFKGTLENPDLRLMSDPPLARERLLFMLATGRKWESVDRATSQGRITADLIKDFVDYFVLAGSGSRIYSFFGISGVSLTVEKDKKGIEVKKPVSDKVEAIYGVEHIQTETGGVESTQKVGAAVKITDALSIEARKELKPKAQQESSAQPQKGEERIDLKFRKRF